MNLKPQQLIGLAAIAVFGTMLVVRLVTPRPDPFRIVGMPVDPPRETPVASEADALTLGPDDARDDLYCSGLIYAAHHADTDPSSAQGLADLNGVVKLAQSGVGKLITAGAATPDQTAAIANAHTDKAQADFVAGTPRLSLETCRKRATGTD